LAANCAAFVHFQWVSEINGSIEHLAFVTTGARHAEDAEEFAHIR
jgi:hypothetical protein